MRMFGRVLFLLSFIIVCNFSIASAFNAEDFRGPKIEELYMVVMRAPDAQIMALENGKLDMVSDLIRPVDIAKLSASKEVEMSIAQAFHSFYFTFNTRRFPWNYVELRQAIWHVIPKEKLVLDLFSGYAQPINTFLAPVSPWVARDENPYPYSKEMALRRLRDAGWTWNDKGGLVAPDGKAVAPVKILSPTASVAPTSYELAEKIALALREIGISAQSEPLDFATMISRINNNDFDACVQAWSMSKEPNLLYNFYHGDSDVRGGYNNSGINDPELNAVLSRLRHAPSREEARKASDEAQALLGRLVPAIPIYSRYSISAVRKGWDGVFSNERVTFDNSWSLLGMTPKGGKMRPLYMLLGDEPRVLNPFVGSTAYDWQVMGTVYESMIATDPESFGDMPWLARSWEVSLQRIGDREHTVLEFVLRDDVRWQDGRPFTARDVEKTIMFLRDNRVPRFFDQVQDVQSVEVLDDFKVRIVMANVSYWNFYKVGGLGIFPGHVLDEVDDWRTWQPTRIVHDEELGVTKLMGTGAFVFDEYQPGNFVRMKRNPFYWKLK